ncbi:MAG: hypothetical protein B6242_13920 [Anaerolineaceae bacterium 4572_78]|nr:MAG: hypothetical protein B6242_13920 [Anaerolineaceae bacterium 4572_78]
MSQITTSQELINTINILDAENKVWVEKVIAIVESILLAYPADALWLFTLPPLSSSAIGVLRNPKSDNNTLVTLVDTQPPLLQYWLSDDGLIGKIVKGNIPNFALHPSTKIVFDNDLGDALFNYIKIRIKAIIPLTHNSTQYGVMIMGGQSNNPFDESIQESLKDVSSCLISVLQKK